MIFVSFAVGLFLLALLGMLVVRWWIESAAERWYATGGIYYHGGKPYYVHLFDRWEADRRARRP